MFVIAFLFIGIVSSDRANAAGTVTVPTEANLRAALAGGGQVTIACDGIITLGSSLEITNATSIDGTGHSITISGNHSVRVFLVYAVPFNMTNVTVAYGYDSGAAAAINHGLGSLVRLVNCTFAGNVTLNWGGAIFGYGSIEAIGCTFVTNSGAIGGAVAIPGGSDNPTPLPPLPTAHFTGRQAAQ